MSSAIVRPSSRKNPQPEMTVSPDRRSSVLRTAVAVAVLVAVLFAAAGCGAGIRNLPTPRRLVIHSGERIATTAERMEEVDLWVREQVDSIRLDPSFMIHPLQQVGPAYPWETLRINEAGDTAEIVHQDRPGLYGPYLIYAHLHLMKAQGRLDRWLPEVAGGTPFEIESAILSRVADAWLYQRSIFDIRPNGVMDELIYAKENGFLDAFILTARPNEFVEARRAWEAENPNGRNEYIDWFRRAFERDPPGLRGVPATR